MVGGVHPRYSRSLLGYQRYTVHERALYFKSTFFFFCSVRVFLRGGEGGFHPLSRFFFEFLGGVSKNFGWFLGFLSFLGGGENACELGDSRSKLEGGRVFQRLSHYKLQVFLAFDGRNS